MTDSSFDLLPYELKARLAVEAGFWKPPASAWVVSLASTCRGLRDLMRTPEVRAEALVVAYGAGQALCALAKRDMADEVAHLIRLGACARDAMDAMVVACSDGHAKVVQILLADLIARGGYKPPNMWRSALSEAAMRRSPNVTVIRILLDAKVDDRSLSTALADAIANGGCPENVEALLNGGADPNNCSISYEHDSDSDDPDDDAWFSDDENPEERFRRTSFLSPLEWVISHHEGDILERSRIAVALLRRGANPGFMNSTQDRMNVLFYFAGRAGRTDITGSYMRGIDEDQQAMLRWCLDACDI